MASIRYPPNGACTGGSPNVAGSAPARALRRRHRVNGSTPANPNPATGAHHGNTANGLTTPASSSTTA